MPEPARTAPSSSIEYKLTESALQVLEREPSSGEPRVLSTKPLSGGLRAAVRHRDRLYIARGWSGLAVLDISVPRAPALISNVSVGGYAEGLELRGDRLVITVGQERTHLAFLDLGSSDLPETLLPVTADGEPVKTPGSSPYSGPPRDYGRVHPTLAVGIGLTVLGVAVWIPYMGMALKSSGQYCGESCGMELGMSLLVTGTLSASLVLPGVGMMIVGGIKQDRDLRPPRP